MSSIENITRMAVRRLRIEVRRYAHPIRRRLMRLVLAPVIRRLRPSVERLALLHFIEHSDVFHINRQGLTLAVSALAGRSADIIETGTSAWGTDSTRLWATYVERYGGECWSVDIRPAAGEALGDLGPRTHLVVGDSAAFIREFAAQRQAPIDLAYLDSWDTDWADPLPSALHGLAEWEALQPLLAAGTIVVIDDTPASLDMIPREHRGLAREFEATHGALPGKGALVLASLRNRSDVSVQYHHYNLVLRITS